MNFILPIIYILFFLFLIKKLPFFKNTQLSFFILGGIFLLKILSGIFLLLLYKYYYKAEDADIFNYFIDGRYIFDIAKNKPLEYFKIVTGIGTLQTETEQSLRAVMQFWYKQFNYNLINDNRLIIRINAVIHLISDHNIYVHSVFFSFFSFVGLTALFKFFNKFVNEKKLLIIAVFLIPSVLIWSSAMLKESIIMLSLGLFLMFFYNILNEHKFWQLIGFFFFTFLMFLLKFYVLFSLIPGLFFLVIHKFYKKQAVLIFTAIYTLTILFFFNSQHLTNQNLAEIMSFKQHDFINMLNHTENVGSRVDIPILEPNFISFFNAIPSALNNTFIRPSFFDVHSVIVLPAVIENIMFMLIFILSIFFFDKAKFQKNISIILFSLSFVITLSIVIGLTTPVLGAVVRYKVPYLPFLAFVFILVANFKNRFI